MPKNTAPKRESTLLIEGANRAEATALLIRCGYRVYRPEVDFEGEDLVLRTPKGKLRVAQMKGVARVEWAKYGGRNIWMLFPSAKFVPNEPRLWYLVPHDRLYKWYEGRHGHTKSWSEGWHDPIIGTELKSFLKQFSVQPVAQQGPSTGG